MATIKAMDFTTQVEYSLLAGTLDSTLGVVDILASIASIHSEVVTSMVTMRGDVLFMTLSLTLGIVLVMAETALTLTTHMVVGTMVGITDGTMAGITDGLTMTLMEITTSIIHLDLPCNLILL
jgi:hypothetical protein